MTATGWRGLVFICMCFINFPVWICAQTCNAVDTCDVKLEAMKLTVPLMSPDLEVDIPFEVKIKNEDANNEIKPVSGERNFDCTLRFAEVDIGNGAPAVDIFIPAPAGSQKVLGTDCIPGDKRLSQGLYAQHTLILTGSCKIKPPPLPNCQKATFLCMSCPKTPNATYLVDAITTNNAKCERVDDKLTCDIAVFGVLEGTGKIVNRRLQRKAKKHCEIMKVAESKLNTIADHVSKALKDGTISDEEFKLILDEMEKYNNMKGEIRSQTRKILQVDEETKNELIQRWRDQARASFTNMVAKLAGDSH